jgi:hypothetical protein
MRNLFFVTATLVGASFFTQPAQSAHVQKISQQSASSMCSGHGGGTSCSYCDPNHCHDVKCGSKSCTNFVYDGPKLAGAKTGGKSGVKPPPRGIEVGGGSTTSHPVMDHPVSRGSKH